MLQLQLQLYWRAHEWHSNLCLAGCWLCLQERDAGADQVTALVRMRADQCSAVAHWD